MSEQKDNIRLVTGRVVSNKMDKSITVLVERKVAHSIYKKYVKKSSRLYAHDEHNDCNTGDVVNITLVRPLSKTKRWNLVNIVSRAN